MVTLAIFTNTLSEKQTSFKSEVARIIRRLEKNSALLIWANHHGLY